MTPEELKRLREIVFEKYTELVPFRSPEDPWNELLDGFHIRRLSKIMHLCMPPELDEVRIPEPNGGYLDMSRETARKILVLGL